MLQRILTGWNFQRILFLILGISLIGQSINQKEWFGIVFGSYFAAMGIFKFGCAAGGCFNNLDNNPHSPINNSAIEDVEYEEVK